METTKLGGPDLCSLLSLVIACSAFAEEMTFFVRDGQPVLIKERRGNWKTEDGFIFAEGRSSRLTAGMGVGKGDFRISVRLKLVNMKMSAAALMMGGNYFGFEGAHGKIFLTGTMFKAYGTPIGDPTAFMTDGKPFTFVAERKGKKLSFFIDEKLVHELSLTDEAIGPVSLLPWRATMHVEQFSASGNLNEKLAEPPKPKPYVMKDVKGVTKTRLLPPRKSNPRNSEGDFIRLKDGRILFVYTHFFGGAGDHSPARLMGRFSDDEGKTWNDKDTLIVDREGDMNVMSASLLRLHNGHIALFYLRKNSITDCRPLMCVTSDEGKTWSDSKLCIETVGYYVLNNDRAVQLKSGRILLPVSMHNTPRQKKFDGRGVISCYLSDDNGKTWRQSKTAQKGNRVVLQEPGVIELADGSLMMFCRTGSGSQFLSFSNDEGDTWSEFKPSSILSPLSPASIERIPKTGDLLLVWNNHKDIGPHLRGKRTPFNVAISKDEGKTWQA
ncbi:MAG: sialidase family protein, partial [Planctomycetota bacterium]|nr:sialidase family protein [Planctomycetota bacterium]